MYEVQSIDLVVNMSLESRNLIDTERLRYPPRYGSVQADDVSDSDDYRKEKGHFYSSTSVVSVSSFSEVGSWDIKL